MSADSVTIILDDFLLNDLDYGLDAKGWELSRPDSCLGSYNNTCRQVDADSTTASLIVRSFLDAASWSVFGSTPPAPAGYNMTLTTDSSRGTTIEQNVSFQFPHFTSYQFFHTDFVGTDDFRNQTKSQEILLVFPKSPPTDIDYILVEATNTTKLSGSTILVDDLNPEIAWNGDGWVGNHFTSPILLHADDGTPENDYLPHYNTTHSSNTEGDSFTFHFLGSSISVRGINPVCPGCELQMNFTVDSDTVPTLFHYEPSNVTDVGIPHFIYFENQSLVPGNHTLTATIILVEGNTSASIDYLTYKPAFDTLLQKPVFAPASTTSSPSGTPSPSPTSIPQHKSRTGIIAGTVTGASVLLVLLGLLLFWWIRRSRQKLLPADSIQPFTMSTPGPDHAERTKGRIPPREANFRVEPSGRKGVPARVVPVNALPTVAQLAELRSQNDSLNRRLDSIETRSIHQAPQVQENEDFADLVREMRTQVNDISRDISRYVIPPAYGTTAAADRVVADREGEDVAIADSESDFHLNEGRTIAEDGWVTSEDSPNQTSIQGHMREIRERMEVISRDINRYIAPPAYETNNREELHHEDR